MRKENLFRNKATKSLVAALAVAMATAIVPVSADAAKTTNVTIAKGDSKKLASGLTNAKSSKSSVATVTKTGKVTAKKAGEAKVTATKKGKKVTYKVAVKKAPTISAKSVSVKAGKSKTVTVDKNGAKYLTVSFKSSNTAVAKVNKNGKITGVKKGTAVVTATVKGYNKNYKLKVDVKVTKAAATNTEEPTTPGTEEPTTPGTEEPTTPGTEEPTTPGTEEPTTPGTEEPTTPDETTGGAIDTGDNSGSNGGSTSGGNTGTSTNPGIDLRSSTATVRMTPETKYLTATIGGQTIKVSRKNVEKYFENPTENSLEFEVNGVVRTYKPSYVSSTSDYYEVKGIEFGYKYDITVSRARELGTNYGIVTVTAYVPSNVSGNLVLSGDKIVVNSNTVEVNNKDNTKATLTVGDQKLTVTVDQARELANGKTITVGDVELKAGVSKDTVLGWKETVDIATGNATLKNGTKVTLHVIGYKGEELQDGTKKHTVKVYASASAAPDTTVSITVD